jgi:hypothetical protein
MFSQQRRRSSAPPPRPFQSFTLQPRSSMIHAIRATPAARTQRPTKPQNQNEPNAPTENPLQRLPIAFSPSAGNLFLTKRTHRAFADSPLPPFAPSRPCNPRNTHLVIGTWFIPWSLVLRHWSFPSPPCPQSSGEYNLPPLNKKD